MSGRACFLSHAEVERRIVDQLSDVFHEEAEENGEIHWLEATRVDPGCWSQELDVYIDGTATLTDEGLYTGVVKCELGNRVLNTVIFEAYIANRPTGPTVRVDYEEV